MNIYFSNSIVESERPLWVKVISDFLVDDSLIVLSGVPTSMDPLIFHLFLDAEVPLAFSEFSDLPLSHHSEPPGVRLGPFVLLLSERALSHIFVSFNHV